MMIRNIGILSLPLGIFFPARARDYRRGRRSHDFRNKSSFPLVDERHERVSHRTKMREQPMESFRLLTEKNMNEGYAQEIFAMADDF